MYQSLTVTVDELVLKIMMVIFKFLSLEDLSALQKKVMGGGGE